MGDDHLGAFLRYARQNPGEAARRLAQALGDAHALRFTREMILAFGWRALEDRFSPRALGGQSARWLLRLEWPDE